MRLLWGHRVTETARQSSQHTKPLGEGGWLLEDHTFHGTGGIWGVAGDKVEKKQHVATERQK
jgi:hypothetical protein